MSRRCSRAPTRLSNRTFFAEVAKKNRSRNAAAAKEAAEAAA
jgi:hypothetical protein